MSRAHPMSVRVRCVGAPLAVLAAAAAGLVALRVRSPFVPGSWGICPWLILTGRPCPTCGGLRCLAALSRGDLALAWSQHAYLSASALAAGLLWLGWLWLRLAPISSRNRIQHRLPTVLTVLGLGWSIGLLAFGLVRWLSSPSG